MVAGSDCIFVRPAASEALWWTERSAWFCGVAFEIRTLCRSNPMFIRGSCHCWMENQMNNSCSWWMKRCLFWFRGLTALYKWSTKCGHSCRNTGETQRYLFDVKEWCVRKGRDEVLAVERELVSRKFRTDLEDQLTSFKQLNEQGAALMIKVKNRKEFLR